MKKLICLILILASAVSLIACGNGEYEPEKSTAEESKVIMTYTLDSEKYEVRYELYRAIFLNYITNYDYKREGFFESDEGKAAVKEINEYFYGYTLDIYSALHLAKKIGYDPYGKDADASVAATIKEDVENSHFKGDHSAYRAFLKSINLNDSVQDLILRYNLAYQKITEHYMGTVDKDNPTDGMIEGSIKYTEEDVRAFYFGSDSVRVSIVKISHSLPINEVERIRDKLASKPTEKEALDYACSCTLSDPYDIYMGAVIGKNTADPIYFGEVMDEAFGLEVGETGRVHDITSGVKPIYWVLLRTEKDEDHFKECYSDIASAYLSERVGQIIAGVCDSLEASREIKDSFEGINHAEIKMQ